MKFCFSFDLLESRRTPTAVTTPPGQVATPGDDGEIYVGFDGDPGTPPTTGDLIPIDPFDPGFGGVPPVQPDEPMDPIDGDPNYDPSDPINGPDEPWFGF